MRFKFVFEAENNDEFQIPINYQYYLHAWFYKILKIADSQFAQWLHNTGYRLDNYSYKMFTFSWLNFKKNQYKIIGNKIFLSPKASGELIFSFYIQDIAEKFIIGVFENQTIVIKNAKFLITQIYRLKDPNFQQTMTYQTITPIKLSFQPPDYKTPIYLPPDHPQFPYLLKQNLEKKIRSLGLSISDNYTFNFELLSKYRKKLVTVKEGRPDEIKIAGYLYQFRLTAPIELQKIGYYAGFGENNPMGFGLVKIRKK